MFGFDSSNSAYRWKWKKGYFKLENIIWRETLEMLTDYCDCKITYKRQ